jgi:hypothetical protein
MQRVPLQGGAGNVAVEIIRNNPVAQSILPDGKGLPEDKFLRHSLEAERAFPSLYGITPKWIKAMVGGCTG